MRFVLEPGIQSGLQIFFALDHVWVDFLHVAQQCLRVHLIDADNGSELWALAEGLIQVCKGRLAAILGVAGQEELGCPVHNVSAQLDMAAQSAAYP